MAEGNWWNSWVTSAKNKSVEVLEFVKKDITEISSAVKAEASLIAKDVKESLQLDKEDSTANTVRKSFSSFFDSLSEVLVPPVDDDSSYVPVIVKDGEPVQLTPFQLKLHLLVSQDETFTEDIPDEQKEQFAAWLEVSQDSLTNYERLTSRLTNNQILRDKYTTLVADKVTNSEFWQRYLFRRALLEDQEAEEERKRKKSETEKGMGNELGQNEHIHRILSSYAEERKSKLKSPSTARDESWTNEKSDIVIVNSDCSTQPLCLTKEDDFGGDIELSEEEQIRLLSLYDEEQKAVKKNQKHHLDPLGDKSSSNSKLKEESESDLDIAISYNSSQSSTSSDGTDYVVVREGEESWRTD